MVIFRFWKDLDLELKLKNWRKVIPVLSDRDMKLKMECKGSSCFE